MLGLSERHEEMFEIVECNQLMRGGGAEGLAQQWPGDRKFCINLFVGSRRRSQTASEAALAGCPAGVAASRGLRLGESDFVICMLAGVFQKLLTPGELRWHDARERASATD